MDALLSLQNIRWQYPNCTTPIFNHFNLTVQPQEHLSIIGASGCGKTTLLRLMSGLYIPQNGNIYFKDKPLLHPHPDISIVFQQYGLLPWKTVRENILLPLQLRGKGNVPLDFIPLYHALGLTDLSTFYPHELSGGQQQRVAIVRSLISTPTLLLLDEPFSALDETTACICRQEIKHYISTTQATLILVTHDHNDATLFGKKIIDLTSKGAY